MFVLALYGYQMWLFVVEEAEQPNLVQSWMSIKTISEMLQVCHLKEILIKLSGNATMPWAIFFLLPALSRLALSSCHAVSTDYGVKLLALAVFWWDAFYLLWNCDIPPTFALAGEAVYGDFMCTRNVLSLFFLF